MLVRDLNEALLLVTQTDHARLAADLLGLVRLPELVEHPRRPELLRAVADHDNGWWETDAAPRVDREGRPIDFLRIGRRERFEIWERGVERFAAVAPYRAALVAAHALRLHADRREDSEWREFLIRLEERREELAEAAGVAADELGADDRWTALADELSLALCLGDPAPVGLEGWRAGLETESETVTLRLEPFPFAGATRLPLRARRIEARRYGRDAELALALATASWERIDVRVAPLGP